MVKLNMQNSKSSGYRNIYLFALFIFVVSFSSYLHALPEDGGELKRYDVLRGMDSPIWEIYNNEIAGNDQLEEKYTELKERGHTGETNALIVAACMATGIWYIEDARRVGRSTTQDQSAFQLMEEAAERGSPIALTYLAAYYTFGIGVSPDNFTGMQLLQKAIEAGSLRARRLYIAALLDEELDEKIKEDDFESALITFANEGDPWALGAMGLRLSSGIYDGDFSNLSEAISYLHKGWQAGNAASAEIFANLLRKEGYKSFNKEEGVEAYSQYIFFLKKHDSSNPQIELAFARYALFPFPYVELEYYEYPFKLLTDLEQRTDLNKQLEMELYVALYAYHTRKAELTGNINSGQKSGQYVTKAWHVAKETKPEELITGALAMQEAINLIVGLSEESNFEKAQIVLESAENTDLPDIKLLNQFLEDQISVDQGLASCTYSCTFWEVLKKYELDYEAALAAEARAMAQQQARNQARVNAHRQSNKSGGGFKKFLKGVFKVAGFLLLVGAVVVVGGAVLDGGGSYATAVNTPPAYTPPAYTAPAYTAPSQRTYIPTPTTQNYGTSLKGCLSDYSCGVGSICVKQELSSSGVCVTSVDDTGLKTYGNPRSNSIDIGAGLPRCISSADCPVGFNCNITYKVCMR